MKIRVLTKKKLGNILPKCSLNDFTVFLKENSIQYSDVKNIFL
jgi:hypothetical protein